MKATKVFTKIGFLPTFLVLIGIIVITASSCDVVEPDADILEPSIDVKDKEVYVLSSGTSLIDLQSRIQSNQPSRISVTSDPRYGQLADLGKGLLQYSPKNAGARARDGFEFTVFNSANEIVKRDSVIIIVETDSTNLPCNIYPVTDYVYSVASTGVSINVLDNDVLCTDSVTLSVYRPQNDFPPYYGTASVQGNKIKYTPGTSFTGSDKLMYKLTDVEHSGRVAFGLVYITNDSACTIVVRDDQYTYDTLAENSRITLPVFVNDTLCQPLNEYQVNVKTQPQFGSLSRVSKGFEYQVPDTVGLIFNDQFVYEVCIDGTCKSATVNIKLSGNSCSIRALDDSFTIGVQADTLTYLNVLKNDSVCSTLQSFTIVKAAKNGTASINSASKTIAYKPAVGNTANDSLSYQICSGGKCSSASVYIQRK